MKQVRALVDADLRVRVDLLERLPVDHGADVRLVLPPRAEPKLLRPRDEPPLELGVQALVDDHPARRGAALPGRPERRPQDPVDRKLEVRVVHDDDRVLAAELEVDVLEVLGRVPQDDQHRSPGSP